MSQQPQQTVQKSILDLSHIDALAFFIKSKNYFTLDIPPYFCFDNLLSKLDTFLRSKEYRSFTESPRLAGNINYTILSNKDGKYAWRPFQIINPILYIALIHKLTAPANWELIQKRFNDFSVNSNLECLSIPVISNSDRSGRATQILYWWQSIEQKSIESYTPGKAGGLKGRNRSKRLKRGGCLKAAATASFVPDGYLLFVDSGYNDV